MKTFGQRVHAARKAKGLTLEALARAIRSHKGYISGIESGKVSAPSPKIIPLLCRRLELDPGDMAALAWWEKRPRGVTLDAAARLVDDLLAESIKSVAAPGAPAIPAAAPAIAQEG